MFGLNKNMFFTSLMRFLIMNHNGRADVMNIEKEDNSVEALTRDVLTAASVDLSQLIERAQVERQGLVDASIAAQLKQQVVIEGGDVDGVGLEERVQQLDGWVAHRLDEVKDAECRLRDRLDHMERLESKVGMLLTQLSGVLKQIKPGDTDGEVIKEQMWKYLSDVFYEAKEQVNEITKPMEERVAMLYEREDLLTEAMERISARAMADVKENHEQFANIREQYKDLLDSSHLVVTDDIAGLKDRYELRISSLQEKAGQTLDDACSDLSRKLSLNQDKMEVGIAQTEREIDGQVARMEVEAGKLVERFEAHIAHVLTRHGTTAEQRLEKASTLFLGRFKHVEKQIELAANEKSDLLTGLIGKFEHVLTEARVEIEENRKALRSNVEGAHREIEEAAALRIEAVRQEIEGLTERSEQAELQLRSRGESLKLLMADTQNYSKRLLEVNGEQVKRVAAELEEAGRNFESDVKVNTQRLFESHREDVEVLVGQLRIELEQGYQEIDRRVNEGVGRNEKKIGEIEEALGRGVAKIDAVIDDGTRAIDRHIEEGIAGQEKRGAEVITEAHRVRQGTESQLREMLDRHRLNVEGIGDEMDARAQQIKQQLKDRGFDFCGQLDQIEASAQEQFEIRHNRLKDAVSQFGDLAQAKLDARLSQYEQQSKHIEVEADRRVEKRLSDYRYRVEEVSGELERDFGSKILRLSEQAQENADSISGVAQAELETFTKKLSDEIKSREGVIGEQVKLLREGAMDALDHIEGRLNENIELMGPRSEAVFEKIDEEAQSRLDAIHQRAYAGVDELGERLDERVIELHRKTEAGFETSEKMLADQAEVIGAKGDVITGAMRDKFDAAVKSMQRDASVALLASSQKIDKVYQSFTKLVGEDSLDGSRNAVERLENILGRAEQVSQRLERVCLRAEAAGVSTSGILKGELKVKSDVKPESGGSGRDMLDNMKSVAKRLLHEEEGTLGSVGNEKNGGEEAA